MWLEIQAALATGKTVKEIWQAAQRDGLDIPYPQFRVYVSRLRRRHRLQNVLPEVPWPQAATAEPTPANSHAVPDQAIDPLHNVRVQLEKKRNFHFEYNPFPDADDDIK